MIIYLNLKFYNILYKNNYLLLTLDLFYFKFITYIYTKLLLNLY